MKYVLSHPSEVLLNPLQWRWGHSGDLTADFAPVVGNLKPRFVKSPVFRGGGVGDKIDKCITTAITTTIHKVPKRVQDNHFLYTANTNK